jgi:hypothetical protein
VPKARKNIAINAYNIPVNSVEEEGRGFGGGNDGGRGWREYVPVDGLMS